MITRQGVIRRLQALAAVGHPTQDIAAWLGADADEVDAVLAGQDIELDLVAVVAVFEREASRPGRCRRTEVRARRAGWVSWLAWDDLDHDLAPVGVRPQPRPRFPNGPPGGNRAVDYQALAPAGTVPAEVAARELVAAWWENGSRVEEIAAALRLSERVVLTVVRSIIRRDRKTPA